MKICMIGLGSIGRKHLGNITTVLKERGIVYEIDALRSSHTALREKECNGISKQYYNIDEMPDDYDVIFITNPTSMHYDTIRKTIEKTKHMFIEKPEILSARRKSYQSGLFPRRICHRGE